MPCLVAILYSMRHRERLLSMAACRLTNASAFRTRPCPGCKDQGAGYWSYHVLAFSRCLSSSLYRSSSSRYRCRSSRSASMISNILFTVSGSFGLHTCSRLMFKFSIIFRFESNVSEITAITSIHPAFWNSCIADVIRDVFPPVCFEVPTHKRGKSHRELGESTLYASLPRFRIFRPVDLVRIF